MNDNVTMARVNRLLCAMRGIACMLVASACSALMLSAPSYGAFDSTDTVQLSISASMLWDDNLFRLPEDSSRTFALDPERQSDRITRGGVGLKLDKTVSRQRVVLDVNLEKNDYERNSNLDHTAGNAGAKWLWGIGRQWSGELSYEHRRRLSAFQDLSINNIAIITKNLVDQDTLVVNGGYRFHPRWRVWAGFDALETNNSSPLLQQNDVIIKTTSAGVDYSTPADNRIGLQLKRSDGDFPNRPALESRLINSEYTETTPALTWTWVPTGKSTFEGKAGYTVREHQQFAARDFDGPTFRVRYLWVPSGKLRFDASAWRELWTAETDTSSYVVASGVRLIPQWAVTPKILLQSVLSLENRSYLGDPGVVLLGRDAREENLRTLQLIAVYSPVRNAELRVTLERGSRTSNLDAFEFDYTSAAIGFRLNF